jgi:putative oxidoreductase
MMVVAAIKVHWRNGFWAAKGGYELPFVLGTTAAVAGVAGPGAYSVDSLLGLPASAIVFVALTAAGCLAAVFASRAQAASSAAAKVA